MSCQITESWARMRAWKWRASAQSISVSRRSRTSPVEAPPSSSSIAPRTRLCSEVSSTRVPNGLVSAIVAVEPSGTWPWALPQVSWVVLSSSSSSGTRSSADRRVAAVRQKASIARLRRRSWSAVNFVGRVKSTGRMWRLRPVLRGSSGSRPSLAASTSAATASLEST
jgi:hypothetical protein